MKSLESITYCGKTGERDFNVPPKCLNELHATELMQLADMIKQHGGKEISKSEFLKIISENAADKTFVVETPYDKNTSKVDFPISYYLKYEDFVKGVHARCWNSGFTQYKNVNVSIYDFGALCACENNDNVWFSLCRDILYSSKILEERLSRPFLSTEQKNKLKDHLKSGLRFNFSDMEDYVKEISEFYVKLIDWSRDIGHGWQVMYTTDYEPTVEERDHADIGKIQYKQIKDLNPSEMSEFLSIIERFNP
jgi:hypothetical protein